MHRSVPAAFAGVLLFSLLQVSSPPAVARIDDANAAEETARASVQSVYRSPGGASASSTLKIRCTINTDNAHPSNTIGGVNVHSRIVCKYESGGSASVDSLTIDVYLYRESIPLLGFDEVAHGHRTNNNKPQIRSNAADDCPGWPMRYYGRGEGRVVFPEGFEPRTGTISATSPATTLVSPSDCSGIPPASAGRS